MTAEETGVLDPRFVREHPDLVKQATLVKRVATPEVVDAWLKADARRRDSQAQFDALRNEQKKLGETVGRLKRELKGGTSPELEKLITEANAIKTRQESIDNLNDMRQVSAAAFKRSVGSHNSFYDFLGGPPKRRRRVIVFFALHVLPPYPTIAGNSSKAWMFVVLVDRWRIGPYRLCRVLVSPIWASIVLVAPQRHGFVQHLSPDVRLGLPP